MNVKVYNQYFKILVLIVIISLINGCTAKSNEKSNEGATMKENLASPGASAEVKNEAADEAADETAAHAGDEALDGTGDGATDEAGDEVKYNITNNEYNFTKYTKLTNDTKQNNNTCENNECVSNNENKCNSACIVIPPLSFHCDAKGDDCNNLNDEYVTFKNNCTINCDMSNWKVYDKSGGNNYTFQNFILPAKSNVTLHTGCGPNTYNKLYWCNHGRPCNAIWNNNGDALYLKNSLGEMIINCTYSKCQNQYPCA